MHSPLISLLCCVCLAFHWLVCLLVCLSVYPTVSLHVLQVPRKVGAVLCSGYCVGAGVPTQQEHCVQRSKRVSLLRQSGWNSRRGGRSSFVLFSFPSWLEQTHEMKTGVKRSSVPLTCISDSLKTNAVSRASGSSSSRISRFFMGCRQLRACNQGYGWPPWPVFQSCHASVQKASQGSQRSLRNATLAPTARSALQLLAGVKTLRYTYCMLTSARMR